MAATTPTPKTRPTGRAIRVRSSRENGDKNVPQVANELWTLTVDYAKQEIRDPVKGLGSYIAWGAVAMLLMGIGCVLLALGLLRLVQAHAGSWVTGNLSWIPYGIVLLTAVAVLAIVGLLFTRRKQ